MCKFFSLVSDGHGSIRYFNAKERTKIEEQGNPKYYHYDSHSSICDYFEINEDKCNKYEYNPFTKNFEIDTLNNEDDSVHVEKQVRNLDFTPIFETGLFEITFDGYYRLKDIIFPEKCKIENLSNIRELSNITFPNICDNINLENCIKIKNVTFPKEIKGYLYLSSMNCRELNNVTFPEKCEYVDLEQCTEIKNVVFPKECKYVDLGQCTEIKNVVLPEIISGYLDLSSLKSLEGVKLPEKYEILYLSSINSSDYVLPEKHGKIYFKDKTVYSNY